MRSRGAHLLTAATLLASMPMHVHARSGGQGEDILVIGEDGSIPVKEESDLERMSREVSEQLSRAPKVKVKQPNPEVQAAAEAKRARKAARLQSWAEKGAIGVQKTATIEEKPKKAPAKKRASKKASA